MENKYKIIIALLSIVVFYLFCENRKIKENMTDVTSVKGHINQVYKADINAIRNLEQVAKKLQQGGLTVAGDLTVDGNIKVKKDLTVDKKITSKGDINSNGKINSKGDIKSDGNGYFGPAYIGKYGKTNSNYAQFSHVKRTGSRDYSILQYKGGHTYVNSSNKHDIYLRNNNSTKVTLNKDGNMIVYSKIPGYLKKGTEFKFKSTDYPSEKQGNNNVVWSASIDGNGNEQGLAVRKGHKGDMFQISHVG